MQRTLSESRDQQSPTAAAMDASPLTPELVCIEVTRANDRNNIILLTRLVLRRLLEHCMTDVTNRMMNAAQPELVDLMVMLEKVLRHGFKAHRQMINVNTPDQQLWTMLDKIGRSNVAMAESVKCVQQLPHVRYVGRMRVIGMRHSSALGRCRAWLRLAVMQKRLADYFQVIQEARAIVRECYDPWAVMYDETSSVVIVGSLVGTRVIDCNLCLKEADLTRAPTSINLGDYITIKSVATLDEANCSTTSAAMNAEDTEKIRLLLDQKNYLEEHNQQLLANVRNLERRIELIESLRGAHGGGRTETAAAVTEEAATVRLTAVSRADELCTAMEKLEASVHHKQDNIAELSAQLDDIKKINIDLYNKLRIAEDKYKTRDRGVADIERQHEKEKQSWAGKLSRLETKVTEAVSQHKNAEERCAKLHDDLGRKVKECYDLKNELSTLQSQSTSTNNVADELRTRLNTIETELVTANAELEMLRRTRNDLMNKVESQWSTISDYERALEEMGVHLSQSKLRVEDLREGLAPLVEAQWEDDKEVKECKLCDQKFTATRRRHHCRNCGGIFCNGCSSNNMALPSSAKPERVCDICYQLLLQRYSKSTI